MDTLTGTTANDTFNAVVDGTTAANQTLTALDSIDGGAGTDILNIKDISAAGDDGIDLGLYTISNIETINLQSAQGIGATAAGATALDMSGLVGLETVNVTKAINANVKVASTVDLNVSGTTGDVTTDGGANVTVSEKLDTLATGIHIDNAANVTVTATDSSAAGSGINVGNTTAVTGAVNITSTGAALLGDDGGVTLDNIAVTGGTTVSVTEVAAASYGDSASKNAGGDDNVTQGDITIDATDDTTTVTTKQDAAVANANAAFTTGAVTETASVKFGALKSGDKLTIESTHNDTIDTGEFTITAQADMTANEVAAAFANLVNDAAKGTILPAGDTQGVAATSKAIYTGNVSAWTSGAADGDTVVFTSTTANTDVTDLDLYLTNAGSSVLPVVTTTQGKANDATKAGGVTGIIAGTRHILNVVSNSNT